MAQKIFSVVFSLVFYFLPQKFSLSLPVHWIRKLGCWPSDCRLFLSFNHNSWNQICLIPSLFFCPCLIVGILNFDGTFRSSHIPFELSHYSKLKFIYYSRIVVIDHLFFLMGPLFLCELLLPFVHRVIQENSRLGSHLRWDEIGFKGYHLS